MTGWAAKRFWATVEVSHAEEGFTVLLDGRSVRTPGKALLAAPTQALAEAMADEWRRQDGAIDPATMPMTRYTNTAIDRVRPEFSAVADIVSAFGETDLLCYRAESPAELVAREADAWDPLLDWAATRFEARLVTTVGVLPATQPEKSLERLDAAVRGATPFELTSLHDLVSLTGSLVLGLAVSEGERQPEEAWALSRVDEEWQIEQWGRDEEADRTAEQRRHALLEAAQFLQLVRRVG